MRDVYNPHIFMQAVKFLLKAKKLAYLLYPTFTPLFATPITEVVMSTFAHACPHNAMHSPSYIYIYIHMHSY